ncbi:hypothetical protein DPV78_011647 [Talaromyces pinophilus]|nr:hypothetical protein DPV78_011647 [Talaromyces pinophilus]
MSTRKLTRDSNIAPDFTEPGTRVTRPRYQEGQQVRYKNVGDREAFSIGTIRTVLKDVIPPVGPEEVRYEIENEQTHTKTAIYEENIAGLSR